ncbi:alpha/beta hydrolase [Caulobacter sp. KR2-114]|uniref:alpha/beta hydrolase n=1 Tax=Caulobacter sp. KR2-114 TaxID=3400912 RepID=UPI003C0874AB
MGPLAAPEPWLDQHYAAPQTLVRIGRRRRLNLMLAGEGGPAVILAPGLINTTLEWWRVQRELAREVRTVAFDKAGLGFSDPGPLPRTAGAVVEDLRAALQALDLAPPYVLVGWSAGGLAMQLFALRHPHEIAGLVAVDSASAHQDRRLDAVRGDRQSEDRRRQMLADYGRLDRLARAGALVPGTPDHARAVGAPPSWLTPALCAAREAQRTAPGWWRALRSESAATGGASSDQVVAARQALAASRPPGAPPLGDMPLIVLTAAGNALPRPGESAAEAAARHQAWRAMHDEIAALSARGERRLVDAGHGIPLERPEAVVTAVAQVLAQAR